MMCTKKDIPSFLKQIYRFGIYEGFEDQIEEAIRWHELRKLPDARAWRVKFKKIFEQTQLVTRPIEEPIDILQEEESISKSKNVYVELKPLSVSHPLQSKKDLPDYDDRDPYIVSKIPRIKTERANQQHAKTLSVLERTLRHAGCDVMETRLIDAFSVVKGRSIIFEVKSITENNENDQRGRAISQLYQYRYRYSLNDALLCVVFSQEPFSQYTIDFLTQGLPLPIHVLWVNQDQLTGVSLKEIFG